MNLAKEFTTSEISLLKKIEIDIEDREYSKEELRKYEISIEDFIMSHSSKNGDISKYINQYSNILNKIIN